MRKNLDTAKAKLTIISRSLSPDEISSRLGLKWDDARRIGDPKGKSGQSWEENVWWLCEISEGHQDRISIDEALDECIRRLRERVGPVASRIRNLFEAHTVELGLYILAQTLPPIHFDTATLSFVYEIGAELDIDIVIYNEDFDATGSEHVEDRATGIT